MINCVLGSAPVMRRTFYTLITLPPLAASKGTHTHSYTVTIQTLEASPGNSFRPTARQNPDPPSGRQDILVKHPSSLLAVKWTVCELVWGSYEPGTDLRSAPAQFSSADCFWCVFRVKRQKAPLVLGGSSEPLWDEQRWRCPAAVSFKVHTFTCTPGSDCRASLLDSSSLS